MFNLTHTDGITEGNFASLSAVGYSNGLVPNLADYADYSAFYEDMEEKCSEETLRDFHLKLFISIEYDNIDGSNSRFGGPYDSDTIRAVATVRKQITATPIFEETTEKQCTLILISQGGGGGPPEPCPENAAPGACQESCAGVRPDDKGADFAPYNLRTVKDYKVGTTMLITHSGQLCKFNLLTTVATLNNIIGMLALSRGRSLIWGGWVLLVYCTVSVLYCTVLYRKEAAI